MKNTTQKSAYAAAGVDVNLGNSVKKGLQAQVRATHGPEVLGGIGGFGGLFRPNFGKMKDPVLVSSVDGVGTKLKIAFATGQHKTIGQDLVNHCVNDIAVIGAQPLFFLDYMGAERLEPDVFSDIISGFAKACKQAGVALIGGETAQMPGMYKRGEYDLAGTIVGMVDRHKLVDGSRIRPGDVILGMKGDGLHTNGYSLARKILFGTMKLKLDSKVKGLRKTIGDELLRVHPNYQPALASLPARMMKGAAHITGGGLIDNPPRILPLGCDAVIDTTAWKTPAIFDIMQKKGKVDRAEMFQVFNMGIGMIVVVSKQNADKAKDILKARVIGHIAKGNQNVQLLY